MKLFGTMKVNNNVLEIGGCNALDLAKDFGTPLYVVDEQLVRDTCRIYKDNFVLEGIETEVVYASKAFQNIGMCKLIAEEGLGLDVVSGGELYTALKAGFNPSKIYMHGNNKTREELTMALEHGVGTIVIDNEQETDLIEELCESLGKKVNAILRVNPGIEAHTHEYIQTTKNDSKFGESIHDEKIFSFISRLKDSSHINFKGFHCHIGSQIHQEESFYLGATIMLEFLNKIEETCGFVTKELNLGGGFGIYYSEEDTPMDMTAFLKELLVNIKNKCDELNIEVPKIIIEPGRSIISNAGTTLYNVGGTKSTYGGRDYIFVDGGMGDNPRPALYSAVYEASIANKMNDDSTELYTIAGKCCESGDIVIKDIKLPKAEAGDIVAVASTGAYNYSMASNYNRIGRPAVVFVKDGSSRIVVKRETYEDLIKNDIM
nr:diaminopimelate decarboxylase [Gottschalkia acidurici]